MADGTGELLGHVQEGDQDADAESQAGDAQVGDVCQVHGAACNGYDHVQHVADVAQDGHEHIGVAVGLFSVVEQIVVDLVKDCFGLFLVAEDLDHLLAVHHLFHHALSPADGLLLLQEVPGGLAADLLDHQHHKAYAEGHHQGHPHAVVQHDADDAYDRDYRNQQVGHTLGNHLAEGVDIVGVIAHHVAVVVGVEITDGQVLHMVEHFFAHFRQGTLGDDGHQLVVRGAGRQAEHIQHHQDAYQTANLPRHRGPVAGFPALFHQGNDILHEHGGDGTDDGVEQDE